MESIWEEPTVELLDGSDGQAERRKVEAFAVQIARNFAHDVIVVLLSPWVQEREIPPGIVAPRNDTDLFPSEVILEQATRKEYALLVCSFSTKEEEASAHRIMCLFERCENVCVLFAQVLAGLPGRAANQEYLRRYNLMLAAGPDDVLMDPDPNPEAFRRVLELSRQNWELDVRRAQLMLDAEPKPMSDEEFAELKARHRRLLWERVPGALMRFFQPLDRTIEESAERVGQYRFISRMKARTFTVIKAVDAEQQPCVLKIFDKSKVATTFGVEGIYREFRFLSDILRHPHIIRCQRMIHSTSAVYLVLDFGGAENVTQMLSSRPSSRFDIDDGMDCFRQLADALAFCHSRNVSHRNIALEHVVGWPVDAFAYQYRIVDFNSASSTAGDLTSRHVCGSLPCISPEIALGTRYVPHLSDCWSAGIFLLETVGGLSSLSFACGFDALKTTPSEAAPMIQRFFEAPGSHARALSSMGAVTSSRVSRILERLVVPNPEKRAVMREVLSLTGASI